MDIYVGSKFYIGTEPCEVVYKFDVLYSGSGWECDPYGYVVKTDFGLKLVHSSHGILYFAGEDEFEQMIEYYEDVIVNTKKALEIFKENKQ